MLCGCRFAYPRLCTLLMGNGQVWFGMFMRDGHQPPLSKKILECPSENCIPHPNRSFFLREFLVTRRCVAALAFPVLLVDEKEPTIHGDCLTIFLKKYLPRLPCTTCMVSEQSIFRSLALPQYSPRIKYRGYSSPLRGGSKWFWGSLFCEQDYCSTAPSHAPIKTGKARADPILLV